MVDSRHQPDPIAERPHPEDNKVSNGRVHSLSRLQDFIDLELSRQGEEAVIVSQEDDSINLISRDVRHQL